MRYLGACGPGAVCPPAPTRRPMFYVATEEDLTNVKTVWRTVNSAEVEKSVKDLPLDLRSKNLLTESNARYLIRNDKT